MLERARVLVVAATPRELAPPGDWIAVPCGVGPVEAAIETARAIAELQPAILLHVGIAGGRRTRALPSASLVIGSEARYCDIGVPPEWAPRSVPASPTLLSVMRQALPDAPVLPIGTSARVGGTSGCDVEAMEGFAVLRAAQRAGILAIEVRAIANEVEEEDRTRWRIAQACDAIQAVTPQLVHAIWNAS